jgi:hypothetical protein
VFAKCRKILRKEPFPVQIFAECSLLSVTLDKGFAECKKVFAECLGYSAKKVSPIVKIGKLMLYRSKGQ